jgi:hypothetical protein
MHPVLLVPLIDRDAGRLLLSYNHRTPSSCEFLMLLQRRWQRKTGFVFATCLIRGYTRANVNIMLQVLRSPSCHTHILSSTAETRLVDLTQDANRLIVIVAAASCFTCGIVPLRGVEAGNALRLNVHTRLSRVYFFYPGDCSRCFHSFGIRCRKFI